jgi:hypothetical protein
MILIDDAAGSNQETRSSRPLITYPPLDTLGLLSRLPSPSWSDTRADVMFLGRGAGDTSLRVGIEIKKITDLIGSLSSGRLQATQLPALVELYDVRWLVVYGRWRRNPESGALQTMRSANPPAPVRGTSAAADLNLSATPSRSWAWHDYALGRRTIPYTYPMSFLASPSFTSLGVHSLVLNGSTLADVAEWIGHVLYPLWQKPHESHTSMRVMDRSACESLTLSSPSLSPQINARKLQRMRVAASLPMIGYDRAEAMADHFPSVRRMINATPEEVAAVEVVDEKGKVRRIGKSIAAKIEDAVR